MEYLFVLWCFYPTTVIPKSPLMSSELFDHNTDPKENRNVSDQLNYKKDKAKLTQLIRSQFNILGSKS